VLYLLGLGDGKVCVNSRFIEGVNMNSETNCERCWGIVNARVLEKIVKHFLLYSLYRAFHVQHLTRKASCAEKNLIALFALE